MSLARKSLRSQIILTVSAVVIGYAALDHAIQRRTIAPNFAALEREEAEEDLNRVMEAIEREVEHLDMRCRDWATWDDTYRFVNDPFEAYVRSNLGVQSFIDGNVNLIYICDTQGRVAWGNIYDLETLEELQIAHLPREQLVSNHDLLVHTDAPRGNPDQNPGHAWDGYAHGLTLTEHGPLLVSSRPILTSDHQGPVRGTLIMGRLIDDSLVDSLGSRTSVSFDRWSLGRQDLPSKEQGVVDEVTATVKPVVKEAEGDQLHVYGIYPDMKSNAAMLLRANVDRAISARGEAAVRYALISTVSAGVLLLLILLAVLQRTVLAPIEKLTAHAVEIGRTDDAEVSLQMNREDEIGVLANEFDSMLGKLAHSRAAVVKAARSAGMSEIATGILHNVGNVLNSVNVSATMVSDRVRNSKLNKLNRISDMVEKQGDELGNFILTHPKGKHVGPYITEVSKLMSVEQEAVLEELENLNRGIEHIRQLVNSQQDFAGSNELRELTHVSNLVDQAIELAEQATPEGGRITVERDYAALDRVPLDRHKLTEILVNLITNARQAMLEARTPDPTLTVGVEQRDQHLLISVRDNGKGISKAHLAEIFHHGFTTKQNGHGFGLHSAANAAVEMQGRLFAESDGEGCGAKFTIELPMEAAPTKI